MTEGTVPAGGRKPRAMLTSRGVILVLLLAGVLFSSVYPMRRYLDVRSSIESLRAEERALDARVADLNDATALLSSDEEVERLAREGLGMVRPGEVPFVVVSPRTSAPAAPQVGPAGFEPLARAPAPSLARRWWDALARAARSRG